MDDAAEVELISDGHGLAVIGEPSAVELFLSSEGLTASRDLDLPRLRKSGSAVGAAAQAASEIAANNGRWVKVTAESAGRIRKLGLRQNAETGLATGVLKGPKGQVAGFVEFVRTPGAILRNPAALSSVGALMQQMAMQQTMDEIVEYLEVIDRKLDQVLQGQKDAVFADLIGIELILNDAFTVRDQLETINQITWNKIDASSATLARTQAYALLQLDGLAKRLETPKDLGDVAKTTKEVEPKVLEWLAVLARSFRLEEAAGVLELDRVLASTPEDLDRHRKGLEIARQNRLEVISRSTGRILSRMEAAVSSANRASVKMLHPIPSRQVVHSSNQVAGDIVTFHELVGIEREHDHREARKWTNAVAEVWSDTVDGAARGANAIGNLGTESFAYTRELGEQFAAMVFKKDSTTETKQEEDSPPRDEED